MSLLKQGFLIDSLWTHYGHMTYHTQTNIVSQPVTDNRITPQIKVYFTNKTVHLFVAIRKVHLVVDPYPIALQYR